MTRIGVVCCLLSIAFFGCSLDNSGLRGVDSSVKEIVLPAFNYAGGLQTYQRLDRLRFKKVSKVFNPDRTVKEEVEAYHDYDFHPKLTGSVRWRDNEGVHKIVYNNGKVKRLLNDAEVASSESENRQLFFKELSIIQTPFQLADKGVKLTNNGQTTLKSGQLVNVIKAEFNKKKQQVEGKPEAIDFYLNVNTGEVVAYLEFHNPGYTYFEHIEMSNRFPLKLHTYNRAWKTDKYHTIEYLLFESWYSEYFMTQIEG